MRFSANLSRLIVSLTVLFLTGCADISTDAAARRAVTAQAVADAYAAGFADGRAGAALPALPSDCRKIEPLAVAVGDRLDVAALKLNAARKAANRRVDRCAAFYDAQRKARDGA